MPRHPVLRLASAVAVALRAPPGAMQAHGVVLDDPVPAQGEAGSPGPGGMP